MNLSVRAELVRAMETVAMERFRDLMTAAKRSGGLYIDRVVSKYEEEI